MTKIWTILEGGLDKGEGLDKGFYGNDQLCSGYVIQ